MRYRRRILSAALCALLLLCLTPVTAIQEVVYFVATENIVLPLTEDTMPFWNDNYLYISSDIFTGTVREATGISRARIGEGGVLIYRGEKSLLFRQGEPYAQDSQQNTYTPGMIWQNNTCYVPASVIARYFDLLYSTVDVEHGKLVWLRSPGFKMQDEAFAKAATFQLTTAYQEYLKSMEPETPPEVEAEPENGNEPSEAPEVTEEPPISLPPLEEPDAPEEPSSPAQVTPSEPPVPVQPVTPAKPQVPVQPVTPTKPQTPTQPVAPVTPESSVQPSTPAEPEVPASHAQEPAVQTETPPDTETGMSLPAPEVYLCLRGNSVTATLLDALDRHGVRAAVFCDADFLTEQGDLLRRIVSTGHSVGLFVRADTTSSALAQLDALNRQLQRTTMEKTRLVFLEGGGNELLRAVREAGFCCFRPDLDRTELPLRTSRQAADLLREVSQQSGAVSIWLGGTVNRSGLNSFLSDAGDRCLPLTETVSS